MSGDDEIIRRRIGNCRDRDHLLSQLRRGILTGEREDELQVTQRAVAQMPRARMVQIAGVGHLASLVRLRFSNLRRTDGTRKLPRSTHFRPMPIGFRSPKTSRELTWLPA